MAAMATKTDDTAPKPPTPPPRPRGSRTCPTSTGLQDVLHTLIDAVNLDGDQGKRDDLHAAVDAL